MPPRFLRVLAGILSLLWLSGCASTPQSNALLAHFHDTGSRQQTLGPNVLLEDVPFFPQEAYQCGPAALATVLQDSRVLVTPDALVSQVYVPARQGSLQIEMLAAARRYERIAHVLPTDLATLLQQIQAGKPVLVMQNLGLSWYPQWHYAVAVGFDLVREEIILRSGLIRDYRISLALFERTWQRAEHWAVVLLEPGELPIDDNEQAYVESLDAFSRNAQASQLLAAYTVGLHRWPRSRLLNMALANLEYAQGNPVAAKLLYEQIVQWSPDYAAAHNNLAQTLFELGDVSGAREHALIAVSQGGSFMAVYQKTLDAIEASSAP